MRTMWHLLRDKGIDVRADFNSQDTERATGRALIMTVSAFDDLARPSVS